MIDPAAGSCGFSVHTIFHITGHLFTNAEITDEEKVNNEPTKEGGVPEVSNNEKILESIKDKVIMVYYINVGNMPDYDVRTYIHKLQRQISQRREFYDVVEFTKHVSIEM